MEKNKQICFKTIEQICENLGEDLNSEFCEEIQQHINECPHCCAYVNSIKKTVHLYKYIINENVPHAVDKRLWKILKLTKPL